MFVDVRVISFAKASVLKFKGFDIATFIESVYVESFVILLLIFVKSLCKVSNLVFVEVISVCIAPNPVFKVPKSP